MKLNLDLGLAMEKLEQKGDECLKLLDTIIQLNSEIREKNEEIARLKSSSISEHTV